jgi:amino acid transporter/nucleotide-binding universal stress UspA family protein
LSLQVRLSRELKLLDITMIGVGAMIGAGIFVLTGIAAGVAGPALLVVFALNGFVALLTAMAYAELGSAFHDAGGGYLWVKTSLPDPNGFLSGWMSWFAHAVACSLYALGFGAYFRLVLAALGVPEFHGGFMTLEKWLAVGTCALFSYINFRGAAEAGKAGNVVTVGKVVVIGLFVAAGLVVMSGRPGWSGSFVPVFSHGWGGVFAAMGLTFIAFEGYEIIAQTSEEVEDPKRNVPRAVFLSLLIVVPIYLLVAFVAIGSVTPPPGVSITEYLAREKELALVSAANQFLRGGGIVILVGGLLSTLSALNATIYSSSRVAFAMARDANLPQILGRVHPLRATPHAAILASAIIVMAMAVLLPIEDVAAAADIMFMLLFVQVNVALIRLRKKRPDLDRGFRVPLVPAIPILAIACMLFLAMFLFTHYPMAWVAAGGWIGAGLLVYYGYSRKREAAFVERERWMEKIERKEYRILVAVSSTHTWRSLMEAAIAIARQHDGEIVAVMVAEVPEGQPLPAGRPLARSLEPFLDDVVRYGEGRGARVRPVIKIARRVSQGIVETAREEECNFLIIGQPTWGSAFERILASVVERVLQDAPCHVGIVYGRLDPQSVKGILLPVTGRANPRLAAELVPAFVEAFGAPARAVTVIEHGQTPEENARHQAEAAATIEAAGLQAPLEVRRRRDATQGLMGAIRRGDLVLMGAPSDGPVAAMVGETVPGAIARSAKSAVIVVRGVEPRRAHRFERLFFGRS